MPTGRASSFTRLVGSFVSKITGAAFTALMALVGIFLLGYVAAMLSGQIGSIYALSNGGHPVSLSNCEAPLSTGKIEAAVHSGINLQRAQNGLAQLAFDDSLARIARLHSLDMLERNYFEHDTPEGLDPTARGLNAGYTCHKVFGSQYADGLSENIIKTTSWSAKTYNSAFETRDCKSNDQIAQEVVDWWFNSPHHRKNILTATFDREGIGVGEDKDGNILVTEDFC
ncbi:CAP domain-containing protein [Candidatus Micrarchaeota archaeon]|nr:CAP domain-containing protein [Candidatus Micrarchaeota archaeon]MBI5176896.1 CAP domain-containing protein [Candidatus Micrarchaeota archaeon]